MCVVWLILSCTSGLGLLLDVPCPALHSLCALCAPSWTGTATPSQGHFPGGVSVSHQDTSVSRTGD